MAFGPQNIRTTPPLLKRETGGDVLLHIDPSKLGGAGGGGGTGTLETVNSDASDQELTTTKIIADITTGIEFDEDEAGDSADDGTNTIKGIEAQNAQWGVVTTNNQGWRGTKVVENNTGNIRVQTYAAFTAPPSAYSYAQISPSGDVIGSQDDGAGYTSYGWLPVLGNQPSAAIYLACADTHGGVIVHRVGTGGGGFPIHIVTLVFNTSTSSAGVSLSQSINVSGEKIGVLGLCGGSLTSLAGSTTIHEDRIYSDVDFGIDNAINTGKFYVVRAGAREDGIDTTIRASYGGTNKEYDVDGGLITDERTLTPTSPPVGGTPRFSAGTTNDWAKPADKLTIYLDASGAATVTGIVAGADGERFDVIVTGTETVAFSHQDAGSAAANRIIIPGAPANVTLAPDDAASFEYDTTAARWRMKYWSP